MLVNEGLPNFIVSQLRNEGLEGRTAAVLGMAFKAESDDIRDSLSFKLRKLLESAGIEVRCTDPYVRDPSFVSLEEALAADIIILAAPHSVYRGLRFPPGKRVIDVWDFWSTRGNAATEEQIVAAAR
jgi:UDP-N-acetyl-D-mannosaminuronic acid dehydrogenase